MTPEERERIEIVDRFASKLSQKFKKIGDTFRFFDRNYDNSISFKEFRVVCEELDMRFSQQELASVFSYLDEANHGDVSYLDFCKLTDEKRSGKDPFQNQELQWNGSGNADLDKAEPELTPEAQEMRKQENEKIMKVFNQRKNLFDLEKFKRANKSKTRLALQEARKDLESCVSKGV